MRILDTEIWLSASDLANHLGCQHLTWLNERAARREIVPPVWNDPLLEVLQERGFEHEAQYLDSLRGHGLSVFDVSADPTNNGFEATVAAMRAGHDVIVQPTLQNGRWFGRADVLRRVDRTSGLGSYSYEVVDTKLARETRGGTILQLCLYSEIVADVQGLAPELMHVVTPGNDFAPESFRLDDFLAYYRLVKAALERSVGSNGGQDTYPEPVPQCDVCRWWSACDQRRRADDHLSLVAGVSRGQRRELVEWGVDTLAELAAIPLPLQQQPRRGARASYERVREQARVQFEARVTGEPVFELLSRAEDRGLALLPEPSDGDMFFDIEGDPFALDGGLEYLLGWATLENDGVGYHKLWSVRRSEEREAFERFVATVLARRREWPAMHVYHFAPYEPSALKRLMGRFGSHQDEVDELLRTGVFIDLHKVAKQAVRASVERYSIKDLEQFYGFKRDEDLREASKALRAVERSLELGEPEAITGALRDSVEVYNRDDCVSTLRLREWLESLRTGLVAAGEDIPRPAVPNVAPADEEPPEVRVVMARLLDGVPDDAAERTPAQQARWLLAHMLEWHRREEKAPWWEYFRLVDLSDDELLEERSALAGLEFVARVGGTDRCPVHQYRFPQQDSDVRDDDPLRGGDGDHVGTVESIDVVGRTVEIKKNGAMADAHPSSVFVHRVIPAEEQAAALLRLGRWVADNGVDAAGAFRAARDLLLRRVPRREASLGSTPLVRHGESTLDAAKRVALELDRGVLAIQGPPGAGKTFTGARMICELVRAGKKVGITALSHKVIRNLLDEAVDAAEQQRLLIRCTQKVKDKPAKWDGDPIREVGTNKAVVDQLASGEAQVGAGTSWLWAREEMFEAVDVLFVDEAGQMSLANVLAVSQAAKSVVLLGDPQQLEQPLQGSHPDGTEASALHHLLGDRKTIATDAGLFLPETWRLAPSICSFTSELFYEGRLRSREDLAGQLLEGPETLAGAGLLFAPVVHDGNSSSSREEVARVAEIWEHLTSGVVAWQDRKGRRRPIRAKDVLVVAPYNAQVGAIGERLPDARVGTVDKFQGQEAPVVIYSMATSTPDEAPRGMEFLYSLNRLNVATSRARCMCILVANPRLFEPECRTPRQMQLANAFCRYLELARTI